MAFIILKYASVGSIAAVDFIAAVDLLAAVRQMERRHGGKKR